MTFEEWSIQFQLENKRIPTHPEIWQAALRRAAVSVEEMSVPVPDDSPEYAAAFVDGYEQAQDDTKKWLTREADRG